LQARISQSAPGVAGEGRRRKRSQLRIVNLSANVNEEVIAETEADVLADVVTEEHAQGEKEEAVETSVSDGPSSSMTSAPRTTASASAFAVSCDTNITAKVLVTRLRNIFPCLSFVGSRPC
jgi:hypothetical protein